MQKLIKKTVTVVMLTSVAAFSFATGGAGKKAAKTKTRLNITTSTNSSLKVSILNNLKKGLIYKGSLTAYNKSTSSTGVISSSSLITYQKGNTTYIVPYKRKVAVADMKPGYAGVKLIIRSKQ